MDEHATALASPPVASFPEKPARSENSEERAPGESTETAPRFICLAPGGEQQTPSSTRIHWAASRSGDPVDPGEDAAVGRLRTPVHRLRDSRQGEIFQSATDRRSPDLLLSSYDVEGTPLSLLPVFHVGFNP
jgi:hypothetical protein